ncbi:MAG: hypothetical protein KUG77_29695 [Nannocystaceae bacterium]|nr:hypothetical protein [Nannocystaceae bacterium]
MMNLPILPILVAIGISTAACGPAVQTPGGDEASTGTSAPSGGSSGTFTGTSSVPPNPTVPTTSPPQTTTDPFDPTTGGSGNTTPSTGDGCEFVCDESGGIVDDCDIFQQDCPRGEKCTPWSNDGGNFWNATRCSPLADEPDQPGEPCTIEDSATSGFDSCDLGSMCWGVDTDTGIGICTSHCTGSLEAPTCPDENDVCSIQGDSILLLCFSACNPLLGLDACPDSQACYPSDSTFICAPDASGEGGAAFDVCEFVNGCDAGNVCANPSAEACDQDSGGGCCLPWCDLSTPDCPGDTTCQPWYQEGSEPPGGELLGVCTDAP